MENVVLGLLLIQSLTLYELNATFKQGISMFYSASYGSLQIALKNLVAKGWIVYEERVEKARNKKIYTITPAGRAAFFQWMQADIPASKLEVTALSKIYFLGLIDSLPQRRQIVEHILRQTEAAQAGLLQMQTELDQIELPQSYKTIFAYQRKTLEYGIHAHAAAREWFAALLRELDA